MSMQTYKKFARERLHDAKIRYLCNRKGNDAKPISEARN